MRRVLLWKGVSILLVVMLLLLPATTAFAEGDMPPTPQEPSQSAPPDVQQRVEEIRARMETYMEAIRKMEEHMYVGRDKLLHLDVASGAEIGVDEEIFQELMEALAVTNARIKAGELRLHEVSLSDGKNIFREPVPIVAADTTLLLGSAGGLLSRRCNGWTGVIYTWWGPRYYLDECKTQALEGVLWMGAGAAAVASFFGVDIPADLIGGILAIGAGAIQAVDGWGGNRGVYFQTSWGGQFMGIWPQ